MALDESALSELLTDASTQRHQRAVMTRESSHPGQRPSRASQRKARNERILAVIDIAPGGTNSPMN